MSGLPYLWLPGLSGSYASTPDSAALSITGDIDIRVKVAMDKWTPSGSPVLAAKWVATLNQRSYSFWLFSDGKLHLQLSSDGNSGATAPDIAANAATGFADGSTNWVRVTWRQSDGRTQFWKSADGASWTQIGTDVTNAASSIFDSTASLEIGAQAGGTVQPAAGKFYRVQIRSNILDDGTGIVFDQDFTTPAEGATTVTESSANAATVTINGFALITSLWAAAPVTAATTASTTDGTLFATPSWTPKTGRLYLLCCTYSAAVTASTPTCSGNSITWTAIRSDEFGTLGSTVFAAISTGGTAGATTLSFGATHTGCIIHVIEVDGADLSGSAAAAIPHHSGYVTADGVSSPQSGALGVVPAVANRTFSVWGTTGTAATPRASWVELADSTYSTPTTGQEVQWRPDASEQTGSITFSGSLKVRGIGLEIRAAQDPLPQHIVAPSGAVQRAANW